MPLQELVEDPTLRGAPTNSQFECCQRLPLPRFIPSCTLPRNGSERNSESLLLFLLHGTEFVAVSSTRPRRAFSWRVETRSRTRRGFSRRAKTRTRNRRVLLSPRSTALNASTSLLLL
jgi:hypothetical protein